MDLWKSPRRLIKSKKAWSKASNCLNTALGVRSFCDIFTIAFI